MKVSFLILIIGLLNGCNKMSFKPQKSAILQDFKQISGNHCESSAMVNMLNYQGYEITETQFVGAGAVPGFVYTLDKFPFLGGRTLKLKENAFSALNIKYYEGEVSKGRDGWEKIYNLLQSGNPVVLRVDMRYLPYLHGGKYGAKYTSFGWHMICLVGIDARKNSALVTDTNLKGIQLIKLSDLHKARFSKLKTMPPEGEFYWVNKKDKEFNPDWESIAVDSLLLVKSEMINCKSNKSSLIGLDGLSMLPATLSQLDKLVPSYLLGASLQLQSGFIEDYGTGGSAFRKMYYNFIREVVKSSENEMLKSSEVKLGYTVSAWRDLAVEMKTISEKEEVLKDHDRRIAAFKKIGKLAQKVYEKEQDFYACIEDRN